MPVSAAVAAGGWGKVTKPQRVRGYRATRSGTHGLPPARRNADWALPLSGRIFGTQSARPVWDIARFPARTRLLVVVQQGDDTELAPWYGRREEDSRVREGKRGLHLLVGISTDEPIERTADKVGEDNGLLESERALTCEFCVSRVPSES